MKEKEEIEEWRDVPGYEGKYQVSNFGNVKTLTRIVTEHRRSYIRQGKILNKYYSGEKIGYYKVKLYNGDRTFKSAPVHRLVAEVFIGNPNNYLEINHIDGNPKNNHVSNLEFCTKEQNVKHAYDTGLKRKENYVGEACVFSKLTEEQVLAIRKEYAEGNVFQITLGRKYNTTTTNINMIVNRNTWKHV